MPDPAPPTLPEVRRVSYADHTRRAVEAEPDRIRAGWIATTATQLRPLQDVQTAFDQLATNANDHRRAPALGPFGRGFPRYARAEIEGARRNAEVLKCAALAAGTMITEMEDQLREYMTMSQDNPDDGPKLTTTGEPHPLTEGGYDPDADPALPAETSDIEALKEGKTTRKQAEALGRADAAASEERAQAQKEEQTAAPKSATAPTSPEGAEKPPPIPPGEPRAPVTNPKDEKSSKRR